MIKGNLKHSSLAVMLFMLACFIISFSVSYHMARERAMKYAVDKTQLNVEKAVEVVNRHLDAIETAGIYTALSAFEAKNTFDSIDRYAPLYFPETQSLPTPDEIYSSCENFLKGNPLVYGICFGFEPEVYRQYGFSRFCPLTERSDSGFTHTNAVEKNPGVFSLDWYEETKKQDRSRWSNVMEDANGPAIVCFCIPLHGYGERFIGVMTVSIKVDDFSELLNQEIKPYEHSSLSIVDRSHRFLVHPDKSFIMKETVETLSKKHGISLDSDLVRRIRNGVSGSDILYDEDNEERLVYTAPIKSPEWTLIIDCTADDIYADSDSLAEKMFLIGFVCVILLIVCCQFLFWKIKNVISSRTSLESELRIASGIQMAMIPKTFPAFPLRSDIDVYAVLIPAKTVGGDLYDFQIHDDKFFFCIGDVSGKGVPASLVMAVVRSLFRNTILHSYNPAVIASSINNATVEDNEMNMFCTMFIGVLDLKTGCLEYCNAGHNKPIYIKSESDDANHASYMEVKPNIAVGLFKDYPFVTETVQLEVNDKLFIYTDGVTEAENSDSKLFGDQAALSFAESHHDISTESFVKDMLSSVRAHVGSADQSDDITMLCLQWRGLDQHVAQNVDVEEMHFTNDVAEIAKLEPFVKTIIEKFNLPRDFGFSLQLALDEAVSNVIFYAYPGEKGRPISLVAGIDDLRSLQLVLSDEGLPFDPLASAPEVDTTLSASERPTGGLGVFLIKKMMDSVTYEYKEGHNVLTMTKSF